MPRERMIPLFQWLDGSAPLPPAREEEGTGGSQRASTRIGRS